MIVFDITSSSFHQEQGQKQSQDDDYMVLEPFHHRVTPLDCVTMARRTDLPEPLVTSIHLTKIVMSL